jgi:hypothetical protein
MYPLPTADQLDVGVNKSHLRWSVRKKPDGFFEEAWLNHVIAIERKDEFGRCGTDAGVARSGQARILLADQLDAGRQLFETCLGVEIDRSVVDQNDFEVAERLAIQTLEHLIEEASTIVARDNNGDFVRTH